MVARTARWAALAITLLISTSALARQQGDFTYTFEQVWSGAIRVVRVDYGCEIRDRDTEAGFFLFEWKDGNRSFPGSVELARVERDGQSTVRVSVEVPAMPSYVEQMIVDKLQEKLRADYGEPPRVPARPRETPRPRESQPRDEDAPREPAPPREGDAPREGDPAP